MDTYNPGIEGRVDRGKGWEWKGRQAGGIWTRRDAGNPWSMCMTHAMRMHQTPKHVGKGSTEAAASHPPATQQHRALRKQTHTHTHGSQQQHSSVNKQTSHTTEATHGASCRAFAGLQLSLPLPPPLAPLGAPPAAAPASISRSNRSRPRLLPLLPPLARGMYCTRPLTTEWPGTASSLN